MAKKSTAKKGKTKKGSGKKGGEDTGQTGPPRIELVTPAAPAQAHTGRIGLGLVLSFPLGWGPLTDAFTGRGAYEVSIAKFLLVVAACTTGATILGRLLDRAPATRAASTHTTDQSPLDTQPNGRQSDIQATNKAAEHQNASVRS